MLKIKYVISNRFKEKKKKKKTMSYPCPIHPDISGKKNFVSEDRKNKGNPGTLCASLVTLSLNGST